MADQSSYLGRYTYKDLVVVAAAAWFKRFKMCGGGKLWSFRFRTNQPMDVKLSQIAVHYLTPPASSNDIERLFSTAADNITDDQHY